MKKLFAIVVAIGVAALPIAAQDHSGHEMGKSCKMHGKEMCSVKDFKLKQTAGSYTVGIHSMDSKTMLCILDSTGKPVTVQALSVVQAGKQVKATAGTCGYVLASSVDLKSEIKVSFKAGGKPHQISLAPAAPSSSAPVNTICPVMGGKADPKYTITHEGKVVAFCCPGCFGEFNKDPKKYMAKLK